MIKMAGGKFTLSDDSHGPARVAWYYNEVKEKILGDGVLTMHFLKRVVPVPSGPYSHRSTVEVLADDKWFEHEFWQPS